MNIIEKHVCTRLAEIANIPAALGEACEALGDTITGVAACILTVPTLGYSKSINAEAKLVRRATFIIPNLFRQAILILNPSAHFEYVNKPKIQPMFFIVNMVVLRLIGVMPSLSGPDYEPQKFSRPVMVMNLSLLMVTKTMDFALGVVVAPVTIATLGYFDLLNDLAYVQLGGLGAAVVIPVVLLFGLVNPRHEILWNY